MSNNKYDHEERTAVFGENTIMLCKRISINHVNKRLIDQLIRSSTSIGANYIEANAASSPKDFRNKIYISKKETPNGSNWILLYSA